MAKSCTICGNPIPSRIDFEGKMRIVSRRRSKCFDCSPFGEHIDKRPMAERDQPACRVCGRLMPTNCRWYRKCYNCIYLERKSKVQQRLADIVGLECWKCKYTLGNKSWPILDFHHMKREEKLFSLSSLARTNYSWNKVIIEARKCCLLCCRCHREVEVGIIDQVEIWNIYEQRWNDIDKHCPDLVRIVEPVA